MHFDDNQFYPYPPIVGQDLATVWDKDAEYAVPVVSPMGNGPKGDKGDKMTYGDLNKGDVDDIRKGVMFSANKSIDDTITTTATVDTIEIPIADYDEFDMLFVDINGLDLAEDEDYEIVGHSIVLSTPIPAGQDVHFRVLRYLVPDGDKTIVNAVGRKDYDTVAQMKADDSLKPGDICHTLGFHVRGDGGAAWYKIVKHAVANEMDVLKCRNCFAILQITEDSVTPEMFGAYGDGVCNDTKAFTKMLLDYNNPIILTPGKTYIIDGINFYESDIRKDLYIYGNGASIKYSAKDVATLTYDNYSIISNRPSNATLSMDKGFGTSFISDVIFDGNVNNLSNKADANSGRACTGIVFAYYKKAIIQNCIFKDFMQTPVWNEFVDEFFCNRNTFKNIGTYIYNGQSTSKNCIVQSRQDNYTPKIFEVSDNIADTVVDAFVYCGSVKLAIIKNNVTKNVYSHFCEVYPRHNDDFKIIISGNKSSCCSIPLYIVGTQHDEKGKIIIEHNEFTDLGNVDINKVFTPDVDNVIVRCMAIRYVKDCYINNNIFNIANTINNNLSLGCNQVYTINKAEIVCNEFTGMGKGNDESSLFGIWAYTYKIKENLFVANKDFYNIYVLLIGNDNYSNDVYDVDICDNIFKNDATESDPTNNSNIPIYVITPNDYKKLTVICDGNRVCYPTCAIYQFVARSNKYNISVVTNNVSTEQCSYIVRQLTGSPGSDSFLIAANNKVKANYISNVASNLTETNNVIS